MRLTKCIVDFLKFDAALLNAIELKKILHQNLKFSLDIRIDINILN